MQQQQRPARADPTSPSVEERSIGARPTAQPLKVSTTQASEVDRKMRDAAEHGDKSDSNVREGGPIAQLSLAGRALGLLRTGKRGEAAALLLQHGSHPIDDEAIEALLLDEVALGRVLLYSK